MGKNKNSTRTMSNRHQHQQSIDHQHFSDDSENEQKKFNIHKKHDKMIKNNHKQTIEESRLKIAKETIQKMKAKRQKINLNDDFFIQEDQQLQEDKEIKAEDYQEQFVQKLKQKHLRDQNKLYENFGRQMSNILVDDAIIYRGHTKCITGLQMTQQYIYSCSKDRSIIKWNREKKTKDFISLGKQLSHHSNDILCLSKSNYTNLLATAGQDFQVKIWDTNNNQLVYSFQGHKNTINGVKFGFNSNNLCSVSSDLTLKQWDFAQRGLIETFYQHNAEVLDIDCFNGSDFLTVGNDHQSIMWKTEKQTKIIFKGHEYAIDRCRTINQEQFITASQDGAINLWSTKRTKPMCKIPNAHQNGWISSLDNIKQSDVFATGAVDRKIKIWKIQDKMKSLSVLKEMKMEGIITDLKIDRNWLAAAECDELRLGRWITDKTRNKIKVFNFHY